MNRPLVVVLVFVMLALASVLPTVGASEGRIAGTVVDPDGKPIQGVQITVVARESDFQATRSTNKKGKFTLLLLDATKEYGIRLEKEGYVTIQEPLDPELGETLRRTWTMTPGTGGERAPMAPGAAPSGGQAARLYTQGVEALQAGDLEKARESFSRVTELEPELAEAHAALGMVYVQQQAYQEAIAQADKVLEMRPGDVLALKLKFEAYRGLGDTANQEAVLELLLETGPDPELARLVFNSGVAKVQAGDLEGAVGRFEQAAQLDPELLPAYSALARVYFDLRRYEDSIEMCNRLLEKDPDDADVLGVLYLANEQLGRTAEAEEAFQALKAIDPSRVVGVLEEMGVAYFNNGDTERAKSLFERVLDAQPDHPQAHYHLALCFLNIGDTTNAKRLLTRFLQLAPEDPEAAVAREMLESL